MEHSLTTAGDKLIRTLLAFENQSNWQLGSLARALDLPKSTVHRILTTLKSYELVEQLPDSSSYRLGVAAWRLAQAARPYELLRQKARPHLERLSDSSGETVFLTAAEGIYSLCIDRVEGAHGLRLSMEVGLQAPLHLGASNLIMLAFLEPDQQKIAINSWTAGEAEQTRLLANLSDIRRQGYVYTVGQYTPGVAALAVPVTDAGLVAALSIGGYAERFNKGVASRFLPELRSAAALLAESFGSAKVPTAGASK